MYRLEAMPLPSCHSLHALRLLQALKGQTRTGSNPRQPTGMGTSCCRFRAQEGSTDCPSTWHRRACTARSEPHTCSNPRQPTGMGTSCSPFREQEGNTDCPSTWHRCVDTARIPKVAPSLPLVVPVSEPVSAQVSAPASAQAQVLEPVSVPMLVPASISRSSPGPCSPILQHRTCESRRTAHQGRHSQGRRMWCTHIGRSAQNLQPRATGRAATCRYHCKGPSLDP